MNVGKALRDHFLRIDARSLGLFRIAMALVLLGDLFGRARYLKDFYSNEGVLPNHNHLFNLRNTGQVWSVLHAFSSPGENAFAFILIALAYLFFLAGYRTRVFHALSLVALVSLTARDILLENAGNYAAIALLFFTLFLPCGSRFSLDSLLASLASRDEKRASELNARPAADEDAIARDRSPGWSPVSLAALAVLGQIALIHLATALQQRGSWRDGTALYYALNSERWVSRAGVWLRGMPPGLLSALTHVMYYTGWAIPVLIMLPFVARWARGLAVGLGLVHGLVLGVFFTFGLYGWTLAAATALLVPTETWDRFQRSPRKSRRRTVIYDTDCGLCLLICRILLRCDLRGHLTFQGNDDVSKVLRRKDDGSIEEAAPPKELTPELVADSVVVIDGEGHVFTRSRAVAECFQALPLGTIKAFFLRIPGLSSLFDKGYDAIARRRRDLSVLIGKEACGIPLPPEEAAEEQASPARVSPSTRTARFVTGALREVLAVVLFVAALAQTTKENALPFRVPQGPKLAAVAVWPRMMARWDILTPEPPRSDEVYVIDAQTRGGKSVDPLTGKEPLFDPGAMRGQGLGQLWSDYLARMNQKEWADFQKAFRDYIVRIGPGWPDPQGDDQISGLDAYWVKQPIPPPGQPRTAESITKEKLFTHSRGGRLNLEKTLPIFRPDLQKR
ncbi:MAG: DCC1-like thiol-disulfide oxidoreductase family protein [Byssovorax sp.]